MDSMRQRTILVVGATGATGRLLVDQLLKGNHRVKAVVRSPDRLLPESRNHPNLTIIQASILDLETRELARHLEDCDAVASCLGHTLSFKGLFGPPRRLVTDATQKLCETIQTTKGDETKRFVLMNTTGNRNPDADKPLSFGEKCILALLRLLVPPHPDNEQAAEYLRTEVGVKNLRIEWAAVRPDSLFNEDKVTEYTIHPSPIRSALFDSGKTSRINVAAFMARLVTEDALWATWKGKMPVIYNKAAPEKGK